MNEAARIANSGFDEATRRAAQYELLRKETKLLQTIDKLKIKAFRSSYIAIMVHDIAIFCYEVLCPSYSRPVLLLLYRCGLIYDSCCIACLAVALLLSCEAHSQNRDSKIKGKLESMAQPKVWQQTDGETTTVHTPFTTRAKELMDLYSGLRLPLLTVDERLDVLLHVKWTAAGWQGVGGMKGEAIRASTGLYWVGFHFIDSLKAMSL